MPQREQTVAQMFGFLLFMWLEFLTLAFSLPPQWNARIWRVLQQIEDSILLLPFSVVFLLSVTVSPSFKLKNLFYFRSLSRKSCLWIRHVYFWANDFNIGILINDVRNLTFMVYWHEKFDRKYSICFYKNKRVVFIYHNLHLYQGGHEETGKVLSIVKISVIRNQNSDWIIKVWTCHSGLQLAQ